MKSIFVPQIWNYGLCASALGIFLAFQVRPTCFKLKPRNPGYRYDSERMTISNKAILSTVDHTFTGFTNLPFKILQLCGIFEFALNPLWLRWWWDLYLFWPTLPIWIQVTGKVSQKMHVSYQTFRQFGYFW